MRWLSFGINVCQELFFTLCSCHSGVSRKFPTSNDGNKPWYLEKQCQLELWQFLPNFLFSSCDFPWVLEEEICESCSPLGLYGVPRRRGETEVKVIKVFSTHHVFSRPEFAANAPYLEKNPITGIKAKWNIFGNKIWFLKLISGAFISKSSQNEAHSCRQWHHHSHGKHVEITRYSIQLENKNPRKLSDSRNPQI